MWRHEIIQFWLFVFFTALALASFECEPPDNNPEKERYKALKWVLRYIIET